MYCTEGYYLESVVLHHKSVVFISYLCWFLCKS